jgi:hypothetical protein
MSRGLLACLIALTSPSLPAEGEEAAAGGAEALPKLAEKAPGASGDVNCTPRPFDGAKNVPLRTSIYFELTRPETRTNETFQPSVAASLQPDQGRLAELLRPGGQFAHGASGWLRTSGKSLFVYIEPGSRLKPETRYTVRVSVKSRGATERVEVGSWSFTTEAAQSVHALNYQLDLESQPVHWHGRFFDGVCNVIFCTRGTNYGPTWELMAQARREHPRAWDLQRDFWLTGMEFRGPEGLFSSHLPNIVRERETRRITAMEPVLGGIRLRLENFFGHEQYGIPTGRPVGEDYHPGEEVLVADGYHSARTKVVAADGAAGTVTVGQIETPADGWKIAYSGPLPTREDPDAPGLFPSGGCYLRKYDPSGTACYYWGRLDKEWDLARRCGRRLMPNFADAPGDLSREGQSWTTVKDYAQWHEVARVMTGHILDRYGKDALGFTWSIFNEPDLWVLFWHSDYTELQKYYDYTTDAVLRAFEDRGYDSTKVFIGGLELGAISGTNFPALLQTFLVHCSPKATAPDALSRNAAVADHRLDGKRSRRVEALCREHGGKGAPCDFISVHLYNRSEMSAAKLLRAKELALEIDPEYYKMLWVDSHEACPDWMPPCDEAAGDVYRGDGYFVTWCADVVHRLLLRAAADPRFAYGETILTVWPPPDNFAALNALTTVVHYRDRNAPEQAVTLPMPIFHVLGLLSDMGERYWALPEWTAGSRVAGGFASCDELGVIRVLLYTHDAQDTQSRSDTSLHVNLDLTGLGWKGAASVQEYRFDRDHNSPFPLVKKKADKMRLRDVSPRPVAWTKAEFEQFRQACQYLSKTSSRVRETQGHWHLDVRMQGNASIFLLIRPDPKAR